MKVVLLLVILFFIVSVSGQKKIKTPIVLSSKDTVRVDDVIVLKKGTEPDGRFKFVRTVTSSFPAPAKCEGYEQEVYYFKYIDDTYYAYTIGFEVDLKEAIGSGEIVIRQLAKKKRESEPIPHQSQAAPNRKEKIFQPESVYLSKIKRTKSYPVSKLTQLDLKNSPSLDELSNNPDVLCLTNMRYCLRKYHSIRKTGRYFLLSGIVLGGGSGFINDKTTQLVGLGVGGGLGITGAILYLTAEKWLKYSTVKPILESDKVGLVITF